MSVFSGNTSSIAAYTANVSCEISEFTLVNKTGGAVTVNVYINNGSANVHIIPYNKSLNSGEIYSWVEPIIMLKDFILSVTSSGSLDFYFSIKQTG